MGKITDDLFSGKLDTVMNLAPFLIIAGEMLSDEEARKGLMVMVNSITSSDDMFIWMEYLGLPTDGWEGEKPPEINLTSVNTSQNQPAPFSALMGVAYAKSPLTKGKLVDTAKLTKLFTKVSKGFAKNGGKVDGKKLVEAVESTTKGMKKSDNKNLRKLLHNPLPLFTAKAVGPALQRKFLETTKNLRMSPLSLMAIVTYLEIHKQANCADIYPECKPFPRQVKEELNKLYVTAFASALNDNVKWVGGREIGGAFHLAMLAAKQLSYELYGVESEKPIGMEVSRKINLVNVDKSGQAFLTGVSYKRRVDIVLKGSETDDEKYNTEKNRWVEVKSLKRKPDYIKDWKPWNLKPKQYSYHRQFYLDRVASTENGLRNAKKLKLRRAEDFEWWLQSFNRPSRESYRAAEMSKVATKLRHLPSTAVKQKTALASLGYSSVKMNDINFPKAKVTSRFKSFSIKNWILKDAKNYLLNEVEQTSIDELITD